MNARALVRDLPVWADPQAAYLALFAHESASFWLDAGPDARSGLSFLGAADEVRLVGAGEDTAEALRIEAVPDGDPALGWFGWISYEAGARAGGVETAADTTPALCLLRGSRVLEFDHARRRLRLVAEDAPGAEAWLDATAAAVAGAAAGPEPTAAGPHRAFWRHDSESYAALVRRCQEHIRAGDAYQLCLTNEVTVPGSFDAVEVYRALRRTSPSHHGALIRAGGLALVSSSPERFLEVRGGRVSTHPIKGTRRRDADEAIDAQLREELLASVKERAENLMIVDLMRNDLSRVARLGTVAVDRLLEVESYPQVHQLVSTVSAELRDGVGPAELLAATFPAGSMTGAPKRRAMQLLTALEQGPRGVYAGAFGRIGLDGSLDLAMTIRSIVLDDQGARIGTGGGITILSVPEEEVEETRIKARALLAVLGADT